MSSGTWDLRAGQIGLIGEGTLSPIWIGGHARTVSSMNASPASNLSDEERSTLSRLLDERASIQRAIDAIEHEGIDLESESESINEIAASSQHPADVASETFERERELGLLEDFSWQRAEVDRAIARLQRGTYGRCETCGAEIGEERLQAVPSAGQCLHCQQQVERSTLPRAEAWMPRLGQVSEFLAADDDQEQEDRNESLSAEEDAVHLMDQPFDATQ